MSVRYRPRRRLRNEVFSLAVVLVVPFVLMAVFPSAALHPVPAEILGRTPFSCAFVTLTPAQEVAARAAARAAWQRDAAETRRLRIDLFADSLPVMEAHPLMDAIPAASCRDGGQKPFVPETLLPTLAAPPPVKIAPQPDADKRVPAFSREELLRIH